MEELKELIEQEFGIPYYIHSTALYSKTATLQLFKNNGYDITPEQFGLLRILSLRDGLYQRQISQLALKDRPNVTRLLDILSTKGFVKREVDKQDRRIIKVFITDKGRQEVERVLPLIKEIRSKVFERLSDDEKLVLKNVLTKLLDIMIENFGVKI